MDAHKIETLKLEAERIALERFGATSLAEIESIVAVLSYEQTLLQKHGKRQPAAYTWRMLKEHGIVAGVERVVTRDAETQGYRALVGLGLQDFAFEAVVVRYPNIFSPQAVAHSASRLRNFEDTVNSRYKFWWVNHKQTFKAEFDGGYIWSPKTNQNGARNKTYENLTQVEPGDVVVSYADAQIKAIGIAMSNYAEAPKPEAFGTIGASWAADGWLVSINWVALSTSISPKAHLDKIQKLLPTKNSPLQVNGNGNQGCYLAAISSTLGELVLKIANESSASAIQTLFELKDEVEADQAEIDVLSAPDMAETEKDQIIRSRRGQGIFRNRVLAVEPFCRITGVGDQSFLIASHIKPWKDCTSYERLDGSNGLMLAPHVDRLFDRGWISFQDDGELLVSNAAREVVAAWSLNTASNRGRFTDKQTAYLDHHRTFIFKDAQSPQKHARASS